MTSLILFLFKGVVQWLVYSVLGDESYISNALSIGDDKQAVYLHKLMFEAILCIKMKHCNYIKNSLSIETKELLKYFQHRVNFETLLVLINRRKLNELIPGDMSNWIELYLHMVILVLNFIRF